MNDFRRRVTNAFSRRTLLAAGASMVASGSGLAAVDPGRAIVLGQVSLSFYAVTGAVVQEVLERLGHSVMVRQGPHEEMYPLLGQGAIDLMAAAWLPEGHASYWARYGAMATELAILYSDARFFWGVPDYVPEGDVKSITDLLKPDVAARMTKLIQGIGTGATITVFSQKVVGEYGLDAAGYEFRPGTAAEWIATYQAAVRDQRWIVFPTWAPQYLNHGGKIRPIEDPRGLLGGVNHASLVGPQDRIAALPAATRAALASIDLGLDGVTEMDWFVNVDKKTPREAARLWMSANDSHVAGWLRA